MVALFKVVQYALWTFPTEKCRCISMANNTLTFPKFLIKAPDYCNARAECCQALYSAYSCNRIRNFLLYSYYEYNLEAFHSNTIH